MYAFYNNEFLCEDLSKSCYQLLKVKSFPSLMVAFVVLNQVIIFLIALVLL